MSHRPGDSLEERVFVSLGANLGDRGKSLERAARELADLPGTAVTGRSMVRETAPVDFLDQPDFLNQVLRLSTALEPEELLKRLLAIERGMGRVRELPKGPRLIDLDILFYGGRVLAGGRLVLPHPQVWNRPFFLEMIAEIDPEFLRLRRLEREQPGEGA